MSETSFALLSLNERLSNVRNRLEGAALRANRTPEQVTLIAISKTHTAETIRAGQELGITDFGENRVQEAEGKIAELGRNSSRWHLVGHLQANKARRAISLFDIVHSLDTVALARRLDRLCLQEGRMELPVLIQIDLGGEETKTGIDPRQLPKLLDALKDCPRLRLVGLMTLPPYFEDPECGRPYFKTLRELRDELQVEGRFGAQSGELSMGMSHDFEIAIAEGATMVRVGTAIFGERESAGASPGSRAGQPRRGGTQPS
ncbi:MAG: YggS family pyridoxal phosphate-dependent enzyme [Acidobacteria bacterium]|nr:YggS family pyridoxal phosphate-dependent enzyme [Acidobacteriota bacterium]